MAHWNEAVVLLVEPPHRTAFAMGVVLLAVSLFYLYGEVRALTTHHHSFAVDPDEPKTMRVIRRGLGWILVLVGLVFGGFFVVMALGVSR